jgi:hypothetical protein
MTTYCCYFMGHGNRIADASVISASSDGDAVGFAIAQLDTGACLAVEIWDGARRVAQASRLELC